MSPKPEHPDTQRYAVLGLEPEEKQFYVAVLGRNGDGTLKLERSVYYRRELASVSFEYDAPGGPLVSVVVKPEGRGGRRKSAVRYQFSATMWNLEGGSG